MLISRVSASGCACRLRRFEFSRALEHIWSIISAVDKYIVERAPWKLAKDTSEGAQKQLDEALFTAAEALRIVCALVSPVLPHSAEAIWHQLGFTFPLSTLQAEALAWGGIQPGQKIAEIAPVFPRLDAKSTIARMQELEEIEKNRQAALIGKPAEPPRPLRNRRTRRISSPSMTSQELTSASVKSNPLNP